MPNITINTNQTTQLAAAELGNSGSILNPNGNYPYSTFGYDQFSWFLNDIARVDRGRTPWVIVGWHQPPYNSYSTHYKEFECGRQEIEPYLYANGVDIVLHGALGKVYLELSAFAGVQQDARAQALPAFVTRKVVFPSRFVEDFPAAMICSGPAGTMTSYLSH